ncbi:hypothetical protein VTO42DRAFT_1704 [Malbranchea cinnamomea]
MTGACPTYTEPPSAFAASLGGVWLISCRSTLRHRSFQREKVSWTETFMISTLNLLGTREEGSLRYRVSLNAFEDVHWARRAISHTLQGTEMRKSRVQVSA